MKSVAEEVLPEIVRRLVDEFDPEQIILFGSRAWGEPQTDSDYDVLVVVTQDWSTNRSHRENSRGIRSFSRRRRFLGGRDLQTRKNLIWTR
jgi:predicted nucleotidyltransferase